MCVKVGRAEFQPSSARRTFANLGVEWRG